MKQITSEKKNPILFFRCGLCQTAWKSDEYKLVKNEDACSGEIQKTMDDTCPKCDSTVSSISSQITK